MTHSAQSSTQPKHRRDLDVIGILVVGGFMSKYNANIFERFVSYIKNALSNFKNPIQM